jgi:branched-chain amino acid transport system ATP-binding protein
MIALEGDGLCSGYSAGDVLRDVSVAVADGEIVGVIGRNGVGKTTLMHTLMGLLPARRGRVRLGGVDVTALPAEERARRGIAPVPQGRGIFPTMSVIDNLRAGQFVGGRRAPLRLELVYGYFPFLKTRSRQQAGTLSGGEQEMLAIARALVGSPKVLLLDEPSDGVQPSFVQEIGEFLVDLNRTTGLSVLLVEQNIDLLQRVAQRAYVLDKGAVVAMLRREEIEDDALLAGYLAL